MAYTIRVVVLLACLCSLLVACGGPDATGTATPQGATSASSVITLRGVIQRREVTSYQYGTHILVDTAGKTLYALAADDSSLLHRHLGEGVVVTGTLRAGYPLDGGPGLLVVSAIQRDGP